MSMICMYRTLTADEARRVRGDEDYLMSLTRPEGDAVSMEMARKALGRMPAGIRTMLSLSGARMPNFDGEPGRAAAARSWTSTNPGTDCIGCCAGRPGTAPSRSSTSCSAARKSARTWATGRRGSSMP